MPSPANVRSPCPLSASLRACARISGLRIRVLLRRFCSETRGEVSPMSYLMALPVALILLFFALDLGLRKGTRLAVEYAAFCAARAAATQVPRGEEARGRACLSDQEQREIELAAAACLASVASKRGVALHDQVFALPPGPANPITRLILRIASPADPLVKVSLPNGPGACYAHNAEIDVKVSYKDRLHVPLSPLNWVRSGPLVMTASASTMLHTTR